MKFKFKLFLLFLFFINCNTNNKNNQVNIFELLGIIYLNSTSIICTTEQLNKTQANRIYQTSFESISEFSSFYSVPQNYQSTSSHDLTNDSVYSGSKSHKAWIYGRGPNCIYPQNCNHRGYPTIQLHKLSIGSFKTPVYLEFYANMNMTFPNTSVDWFSFATFSADASDAWRRVVLINMDYKNNLFLQHVPLHNQNTHTYQTTTITFPQNQWVKVSTCLDFSPAGGSAKVWQNDILVSGAKVEGTCGVLEQVHLGLYASPTLSSGTIYNDSVLIKEVTSCQ